MSQLKGFLARTVAARTFAVFLGVLDERPQYVTVTTISSLSLRISVFHSLVLHYHRCRCRGAGWLDGFQRRLMLLMLLDQSVHSVPPLQRLKGLLE